MDQDGNILFFGCSNSVSKISSTCSHPKQVCEFTSSFLLGNSIVGKLVHRVLDRLVDMVVVEELVLLVGLQVLGHRVVLGVLVALVVQLVQLVREVLVVLLVVVMELLGVQ